MKPATLLCVLCYMYSLVLQAQDKKITSTERTTAFSTTSSGLQYKIIKDSVGGIYPEKGGFITFRFEMRTNSDSIFDSQFLDNTPPVGAPTPLVTYKPSIEEGLLLLTEGDSALFVLNADSLYTHSFGSDPPYFISKGSPVHLIVKMGKIYSKDFVDSVRTAAITKATAAKKVYEKDSLAIKKYLTEHQLKAEAIDGGMYIVKLKSASAKTPYIIKGEIVEVTYVGKLLIEGTEFDRSGNTAFQFTVGFGEVITGWDYAFQRLKPGEKALLLIPSNLAYGNEGVVGIIPQNAPLLFEVDIKK